MGVERWEGACEPDHGRDLLTLLILEVCSLHFRFGGNNEGFLTRRTNSRIGISFNILQWRYLMENKLRRATRDRAAGKELVTVLEVYNMQCG